MKRIALLVMLLPVVGCAAPRVGPSASAAWTSGYAFGEHLTPDQQCGGTVKSEFHVACEQARGNAAAGIGPFPAVTTYAVAQPRRDNGAALLAYSAAMFRASNPQVAPVWNPQCHEVLSVYGDMLACQ